MLTFGAKKEPVGDGLQQQEIPRQQARGFIAPLGDVLEERAGVGHFSQEPQVQVCFKAWGAQAAIPFRVSALADAGQRLLRSSRAGFRRKLNWCGT
jgi:hypothetical protein